MRIRLLTGMVSVKFAYDVGDELDWPDIEAVRLIASGAAEACGPAPIKRAIETAIASPLENAALPAATRKVKHGRNRA